MEASSFIVASAIAGQQNNDARVTVVVQSVLQHSQLQHSVGRFLLTTVRRTAIEQTHFHTATFKPIPQLAHLGWHGASGNGVLNLPFGTGQTQQRVEIDAHEIAGARTLLKFFSKALRLNEDIGVVPVDENAIHEIESSRYYGCDKGKVFWPTHSLPAAGRG